MATPLSIEQTHNRLKWAFIGLTFFLLLCFMLDIALGSVQIPLAEVFDILFTGNSTEASHLAIIQKIRLPRAFTAILVGSALSVAGLQMQTLFRNPLAGPSVLGITAGSSLGVAAVMLATGSATTFFAIQELDASGHWIVFLASTLGAAFVLVIVMLIAYRIRDNVVMLIVGLMIANITIAIVSVWQFFSRPEQIQEYLLWTFGSLGGVTSDQLSVMSILVVAGILLTFLFSKSLNVLLLGEDYAQSMGLSVMASRIKIIIATSLLAGTITGFCGPIGFVGIAVPHLARSVFNTSDHKVLIPGTILIGALLMLICDIISQVPGSNAVLPINAITALIGSPVVIWIIVKRRNLKSGF